MSKKEPKDIHISVFDDYAKCNDPVKTEETIFNKLIESNIDTDYHFMALPLAKYINEKGLHVTQNVINQILNRYGDKKIFFVCQHIKVSELDFRNHLVFTPHATKLDNFEAIPHYAANICPGSKQKPFLERKLKMSFRGSFITHPVRKRLETYLTDRKDCKIIDTGRWHFEKNKDGIKENGEIYKEELGNTKIALCPRGTGPSTIRIWESMASGCVPMILSDHLQMPLSRYIDWHSCVLFCKENDVPNIEKRIPSEKKLEEMSRTAKVVYNKYFNNVKLHNTIVKTISGIYND